MPSFFVDSLNDEEFEDLFKRFCSMIVFYEKKKLSISSIFIFLIDNQEFLDILVEEANLKCRVDCMRRILKLHPNIAKSKVIIYKALLDEDRRKAARKLVVAEIDDETSGESE